MDDEVVSSRRHLGRSSALANLRIILVRGAGRSAGGLRLRPSRYGVGGARTKSVRTRPEGRTPWLVGPGAARTGLSLPSPTSSRIARAPSWSGASGAVLRHPELVAAAEAAPRRRDRGCPARRRRPRCRRSRGRPARVLSCRRRRRWVNGRDLGLHVVRADLLAPGEPNRTASSTPVRAGARSPWSAIRRRCRVAHGDGGVQLVAVEGVEQAAVTAGEGVAAGLVPACPPATSNCSGPPPRGCEQRCRPAPILPVPQRRPCRPG